MLKKYFICYFVSFVILLNLNITSYSQNFFSDEQVNISVYEKVAPAIVAIDVNIDDGVSSGTGCIIDQCGLILTSSHILESDGDINVTTHDGNEYKAKLIAVTTENSDLALIKIDTKKDLPIIDFGDSTKIKIGQKVFAIGNPFGFSSTLTMGIISRLDYRKNKIQTDAAINPGSSGGPLLNSKGEVIGINQSIYNPDNNKSNIGIGFAVPVNAAKRFIIHSKKSIIKFIKADTIPCLK